MAVDFQALVDGMAAMTCVVSVEKQDNGGYGAIRIVTGNRAYLDTIEKPAGGMQMLTQKFVPNSEYTEYLTRDLNFEEYCYRAAVGKQCLHSYAHPDRMNVWFNMTFLPLDADDGNLCFCTYTMEINFEPSSERLSNVSGEVASRVLEQAIAIRSADDFNAAMSAVIADIRTLCDADFSCIMLVDEDARSCEVIAQSIAEGSSLRPMEAYVDDRFYEIVDSWKDTIAGSNCIIAKNEHDMDVVKERNPRWHASLASADVDSIVLFPLKSHGSLLGYIWAVNFNPDDSLRIKEALELTTYVLASEIDNHLLLNRLKTLGTTDMLTGIQNRNEMDIRIRELSEGNDPADLPVGVVFADLNGLKAVNDEGGHAAGDQLLKDATAVFLKVFDRNEVYRAGGDEFVAIITGMGEDGLAAKIAALREETKGASAVSFALGSCLANERQNIAQAVRTADARMYDDKRHHYEEEGCSPAHFR